MGYDAAVRLTPEVEQVYVRALIAIARADRDITSDEGARLGSVVERRFPGLAVDELLFEPTLRLDEVVKVLGGDGAGGPFRNAPLEPAQLGRMFVEDALQVIVASDGVSSVEEAALLRFAPLFGAPVHEVRQALGGAR